MMSQPAHKVLLLVQNAVSNALLGPDSPVSSLLLLALMLFFFLQLAETVRTLCVQNLCSITLIILMISNLFVHVHIAGSHGF